MCAHAAAQSQYTDYQGRGWLGDTAQTNRHKQSQKPSLGGLKAEARHVKLDCGLPFDDDVLFVCLLLSWGLALTVLLALMHLKLRNTSEQLYMEEVTI